MKPKTFLIADTETTGLAPNNLVFDFGYTIATRKNVLLHRSFLVREILCNPAAMLRAIDSEQWRQTFGGKIFSHYIPNIAAQEYRIYSWREIVAQLREDMREFSVDVFCAYNIDFDMRALAKTNARISGDTKILEYKPDLLDIWLFACNVALNRSLYHTFCEQYGFISPAGNVRTTAEKTYAYLTGNPQFVEQHTALADAIIETEILQRLLKRRKAIPYNQVNAMPWKIAQKPVDKTGKLL